MSVLIVGKFQGDTAKFRQALTDRGGEFAKIADRSRSVGAIVQSNSASRASTC